MDRSGILAGFRGLENEYPNYPRPVAAGLLVSRLVVVPSADQYDLVESQSEYGVLLTARLDGETGSLTFPLRGISEFVVNEYIDGKPAKSPFNVWRDALLDDDPINRDQDVAIFPWTGSRRDQFSAVIESVVEEAMNMPDIPSLEDQWSRIRLSMANHRSSAAQADLRIRNARRNGFKGRTVPEPVRAQWEAGARFARGAR